MLAPLQNNIRARPEERTVAFHDEDITVEPGCELRWMPVALTRYSLCRLEGIRIAPGYPRESSSGVPEPVEKEAVDRLSPVAEIMVEGETVKRDA